MLELLSERLCFRFLRHFSGAYDLVLVLIPLGCLVAQKTHPPLYFSWLGIRGRQVRRSGKNLPPIGLWLLHINLISLDEMEVSNANSGIKPARKGAATFSFTTELLYVSRKRATDLSQEIHPWLCQVINS
jgi:hypothetical protein